MGITTCRLEGPVDFYSVGQFVSGPGWRHLRRTIDTFELMFVRRGVLPMRVGEQTLHIEAGQIALLPPNVEHAGADIITSDVDFYWMHFKLPDARMLPDDAGLPQDDHCLLLPDERTLPDPDRLAVMCGQLIDIYARFGPYSNAYCDYFATGLLLEVSAQERLKADFAAHRTLAGYRGDGKPITSADRVRQQQEWAMHVDSAGAAGDSSGLAPMLAIRSWIMANAFDDITVAKVAARFHYSPSYLTAMYRRVFGVGVAEQIKKFDDTVTVPIGQKTIGEIIVSTGFGKMNRMALIYACSDTADILNIASGETVLIIEVRDNIAYVTPYRNAIHSPVDN